MASAGEGNSAGFHGLGGRRRCAGAPGELGGALLPSPGCFVSSREGSRVQRERPQLQQDGGDQGAENGWFCDFLLEFEGVVGFDW